MFGALDGVLERCGAVAHQYSESGSCVHGLQVLCVLSDVSWSILKANNNNNKSGANKSALKWPSPIEERISTCLAIDYATLQCMVLLPNVYT